MKTTWIITMAVLLAGGASVALGQSYEPQRPTYQLYHGDDGYYGGFYAGTYEGSALYGLGAFARGVGQYNYYSALAARERQEARALAIRNHELAVANWLSRRAAHRERVRAEMLTPEQVALVVEANRPDRLTAAQYQPGTGKLTWPAVLQGEGFAEERAALEEAFGGRTSRDSGAASAFYAEVRERTEQMLDQLREKLPELRPMEYIAARKFLVGLKYEALSPAGVNALAMAD